MPTWPADLPDHLLVEGYGESPPDTSIRTTMEAGVAKVRRRFTYAARPIAGALSLTRAQVESLDVFYRTDTQSGALRFSWRHPRFANLTAVQMRFTAAPRYEALEPEIWRATLQLEIV
jgi:hypothetical protein